MNSFVPIYVGESVSGASIRMDDGNRESVNVWNGYAFFNKGYADKDGMLVLDYNDFTITGEMSSLELKKEKPCK